MSRSLSAVTQAALNASETIKLFLVLIEIDHTDLGSPIRIVNNTEDVTSNGDLYSAFAFEFKPPMEVDGTIKSTSIVIDGVDRSIVTALRSINTPATVEASIIRQDAPNVIEAGPWTFLMRNVTWSAHRVSGELVPNTPLRIRASTLSYRNIEFPGLYG